MTTESKQIANQMRAVRVAQGMTLEYVARQIGISYQQLQKYENGTNRVPTESLVKFTALFGMNTDDFYALATGKKANGMSEAAMEDKEILDVARAIRRIKNSRIRKALLKFCRTLINTE